MGPDSGSPMGLEARPGEGAPGEGTPGEGAVSGLWDYRRQVADLYHEVRALARHEEGRAAWLHWRAVRDRLFAGHAQSPVPAAQRRVFAGLTYFPYDPAWRLTATLETIADGREERIDAGQDGVVRLTPFARSQGLAGRLGRELTLYWIGGYGGGVFLPFRDASAGQHTYGGGRYLLDTIKSADLGRDDDGRTVFDFNFAYNPSCVWSDLWVCPLAPDANRLNVPIMAGERWDAPATAPHTALMAAEVLI
ncbi:MAG: DUF1684 domain-containing protein [Alphaproteobacteria bacterium]